MDLFSKEINLGVPSYWKEYPERDVEYVHWYPCVIGPISEEEVWRPKQFSYYVHIPFCNEICHSCIYNKYNPKGPLVKQYVEALKKEIINYGARPYLQDGVCTSGYFGGGTPTALSTEDLNELFVTIRENLNLANNPSITVESTPNNMSEQKAEMLVRNGVERVSMGVQTFDDMLLPLINRIHSADDARKSIQTLRKAGVKHICIDLMIGIPGQNMKNWLETIDAFIDLKLESLSIYTFFLIPDDVLAGKIRRGVAPPLPSKEEIDEMFDVGIQRVLKAEYFAVTAIDFGRDPSGQGLERYGPGVKVYNLGEEGLHGMIASTFPPTAHLSHTWYECGDLLGMGTGAYGYIKNHMYLNEPNIEEYIRTCNAGALPVTAGTYVSPEERMHRSMVLGSKFLKVLRKDFVAKHGVDILQVFPEQIEKLEQQGLVKVDDETFEVSYPKGWHYMDNVSKTFYSEANYKLPQPTPMNTNILKWLRGSQGYSQKEEAPLASNA
jgi:oxygen-independent coproporphyrinogen III oxidase